MKRAEIPDDVDDGVQPEGGPDPDCAFDEEAGTCARVEDCCRLWRRHVPVERDVRLGLDGMAVVR